jgi:ABC-type transporter Mla subunit MlaD
MDRLLEALFKAVMLEWVPWSLAGAIIAYAAFEYARLYFKLRPVRESIQGATKSINAVEDASAFVERYEAINEYISTDRWVGYSWREFRETLLLPDRVGFRIRNTVRPSQYISAAALIQYQTNLRYFQAIPNILVGLGLCFTFIGLIAALFFAARGVASASIQEAQSHLKDLLAAATFKFVTSVAGLGSSITFSIAQKRLFHDFSREVEGLCKALGARVDFTSPAAIADQSHNELAAQTRELQKFNTDLAFSLAEAIDKRLSESFSQVMAPMANAIDQMAGRFGEMNQNALERMIGRFSETLEGAAGKQIEALAAGMAIVKDELGSLSDRLDQAGRVLGELDEHLGRHRDGLGLLHRELDTTVTNVRNTIEALGQTAAPLGTASDSLENTVGRLAEVGQSLEGTHAAATELTRALHDTTEAATAAWSSYRTHFESLDETLAHLFVEINTGLATYHDKVAEFVSKIDEQMANSVGMLSGGVNELAEAIENLEDMLVRTIGAAVPVVSARAAE